MPCLLDMLNNNLKFQESHFHVKKQHIYSDIYIKFLLIDTVFNIAV